MHPKAFILLVVLQLNHHSLAMKSLGSLPFMEFTHKVVLDSRGSYIMMWNPTDDKIIIEVQVRNLGYVGFGFSPNGGMKGADIVVGWIDDEGIVQFSDRHGVGNTTPIEDDSQDYQLLGGSRNDTHTIIRFSRLWDTCDSNNDLVLTGDTVRVIWSYGDLHQRQSKKTIYYHDQNRGTKSLYLMEPKVIEPPPVTRVQTWDIRSPEVEIPGDLNTLYWCKIYKLPILPWKHQMIGYVPIIEEKSLPHVHHMLLYECSIPDSDIHLEKWLDQKGSQCYSKNMPLSWRSCGAPIVAWAIGSEGEMLPEHVGFPLGEKHGGGTYFLLEIHYDNPKYMSGIVDHSGLRLLLTDKIRPFDAGVLTLGHKVDPFMMIPPARPWTTTAHCSSDCTQKGIPSPGINIYSGVLHAHLMGHAINVSHIRDGIEMEPLLADNSYDFNYQQARIVSPERIIYPGDHLITKCGYDATKRTKPTFGGFGTEEEMCLAFLFYYPRIEFSHCYSRPDPRLLLEAFGIQNLFDYEKTMNLLTEDIFGYNSARRINSTQDQIDLEAMKSVIKAGPGSKQFLLAEYFKAFIISQPARLRGQSFYEILNDERIWRDENFIRRLEEIVSDSHYEPVCLYTGRRGLYGVPNKVRPPKFSPYQNPTKQCTSSSSENSHVEQSSADDPSKYSSDPGNSWPTRKFSWQISIQWIHKGSRFHVCSGAIIGNHWVLTAAHCTRGFLLPTLEFVAGDDNLRVPEGNEQILRAANIYEHMGYNPVTQENDLALVKMDGQFNFDSQKVTPVNLPTLQETFKGSCAVSGWQKISNYETVGNLQKLLLPVISNNACQEQISLAGYRMRIKDTMMCTGFFRGGEDFCKGDSGGPLVCQGNREQSTLAGIVSWGIGCNSKNIPGVYTEVSQYIPWINQRISEDKRQSYFKFPKNDRFTPNWKVFPGKQDGTTRTSSFQSHNKNNRYDKRQRFNPTFKYDFKPPEASNLPGLVNVNLKDYWNSAGASQGKSYGNPNSFEQVPVLVHLINSSEEESSVFSNPYQIN